MEIAFDRKDRAVARTALRLALKRAEALSPKMVELTIPTMPLDVLVAQFGRCAKDVLNDQVDNFNWSLELRLAMLTALFVYTTELLSLQGKEVKLDILTDRTEEKLGAVERLRDEMRGQGRLPLAYTTLEERLEEAIEKVEKARASMKDNQLTLDGIGQAVVDQVNAGALGPNVTAKVSRGGKPKATRSKVVPKKRGGK